MPLGHLGTLEACAASASLQWARLKKEGEEKPPWRNIRLLYNLFVVSLERENERGERRGTWNRSDPRFSEASNYLPSCCVIIEQAMKQTIDVRLRMEPYDLRTLSNVRTVIAP